MPYAVRFSKEAFKDARNLSVHLQRKLREVIAARLAQNPYSGKKLVGDLTGLYSVRLSLKDRVVYSIDEEHRTVYIHRAKTHYGK